MPNALKELIVQELEDRFRDADETGFVVVNYQGLTAPEARSVREVVRESGGEMTVIKNRLFARAMAGLGAPEVESLLDGAVAVVRCANVVDAAKAVRDAAKSHEALVVRGAYVDEAIVDAAAVERLADMPSGEEMLAQIAGLITAPARRLLAGLLAKPRALVNGLEQLRKRTEEEAAA